MILIRKRNREIPVHHFDLSMYRLPSLVKRDTPAVTPIQGTSCQSGERDTPAVTPIQGTSYQSGENSSSVKSASYSQWLLSPLAIPLLNINKPDEITGLLILVLLPIFTYFFVVWLRNRKGHHSGKPVSIRKKRITVTLEKNKVYFPDYLILRVTNNGRDDADLDRPLLVFSKMWLRRSFRLKGTNHHHFYPLLLEPGKTHELTIELYPFYRYDKRLKTFSKISVSVNEVNSKKRVSQSVIIRKTLLR